MGLLPFSWGAIRSLAIFFAPILVPKAISYYRSVRNGPQAHGLRVRPVPRNIANALFILFIAAGVFLLKTLPILAPENIFQTTQSRLQIPVDVLFNRLASVRPNGTLTAQDTALRARFVSQESRLLYFQFGPDVLASCPFCTSDDPSTFFWYALPALLAPHLANLALIALVTSPVFTGREGSSWRTTATLASIALLVMDIYATNAYPYQENSRATRLSDLEFFFWLSRTARFLALAALDALLGWVLFLTATNRAFVTPPTPAERVEAITRLLAQGTKTRIHMAGVVKNTVARDEVLRARGQQYWAQEVGLMREVMEEREVIEGMNDALQNRIDIQSITRDAELYAQDVVQPLEEMLAKAGVMVG